MKIPATLIWWLEAVGDLIFQIIFAVVPSPFPSILGTAEQCRWHAQWVSNPATPLSWECSCSCGLAAHSFATKTEHPSFDKKMPYTKAGPLTQPTCQPKWLCLGQDVCRELVLTAGSLKELHCGFASPATREMSHLSCCSQACRALQAMVGWLCSISEKLKSVSEWMVVLSFSANAQCY